VIALLALVGLLVAVALMAVGVLLHRDLAQINDQLERSNPAIGLRPELNQLLDQLWADVQQLHDQHVKATDKRLRDIEAALAQVRQHEAELARYVNWMAPLVQQWANATAGSRR
jgi:type II secretory pathway component PulJ